MTHKSVRLTLSISVSVLAEVKTARERNCKRFIEAFPISRGEAPGYSSSSSVSKRTAASALSCDDDANFRLAEIELFAENVIVVFGDGKRVFWLFWNERTRDFRIHSQNPSQSFGRI